MIEGTASVVPDVTIANLITIGGEGTITYSLVLGDGSDNNDRFKISRNEVQVNSVALTEGSYSFRVKSDDSEGSSFEKSFIVVVVAQPRLPVNFVALIANGFNDTETTAELTLLFSSDPTTLEAGDITLIGADKGELSGTGPIRSLEISNIGVNNGDEVTVTLMSPAGYDIMPSSRNIVVFVKTEVPIALDTTPPSAGEVGLFYEGSFETTGGTGPYSYTITSGELPTGLNLSVGGELSGTATVAGTFTFAVTVAGDDGETDAHGYSLTIAPEPVIQVSSVEDLNNVRNDLDENYIQTADIDLSGAPWVTIGTYSNHFTGNYDKITNLNFTGGHNVGLFSVISGNIENLVLENISISSGSRVGGFAGRLWDGGTIRNTHIQGTGRIYGDFVIGGLVGDNRQLDSHIIEPYANGKVTGTGSIGGLVGLSHDGTVEKSYYGATTSLKNDIGSGTPKLTEEMQQAATFVGWDFVDVWTIDEGVT